MKRKNTKRMKENKKRKKKLTINFKKMKIVII